MFRRIRPRIGNDGELQNSQFCVECGQVNSLRAKRCKKCGAFFPTVELPASTRTRTSDWLQALPAMILMSVVVVVALLHAFNINPFPPAAVLAIRATAAEPSTLHAVSNPVTDTTSRLVTGDTLPSEADSACLPQMPQNEPLIAANYGSSFATGIALLSSDGSRLCHLTAPVQSNAAENIYDSNPHWISATEIGFDSSRTGNTNFIAFVVNVDGSHFHLLSMTGSNGLMFNEPTWSPDGKNIAFITEGRDFSQNISIANADGTELHQLTAGEDVNSLAWSLDSRWIFFTTRGETNENVYKVAADGSSLGVVPGPVMNDISFTVSPDGKSLVAVFSDLQTGYRLSIENTDGTSYRELLVPGNHAGLTLCGSSPLWLPDTNSILFIAAKMGEKCGYYKIKPDGTGIEKFYNGPETISNLAVYYPAP